MKHRKCQARSARFENPGLLFVLLLALITRPLSAATVSWIGGSGDWNTATNWNTGALPGTNDDVVISPVATSITVTHSSGTHSVKSLMSQRAFQLTGGSLTVSNTVQVNNMFTLAGGTLAQATVLQGTNGAGLIVNGSGTLNGVTVNGILDVGNSYYNNYGASLTVANGLVLNGTALVGNPTNNWQGGIGFAGSQTLSGAGAVVFGSSGNNSFWLSSGGSTLTIGPGITAGRRIGAGLGGASGRDGGRQDDAAFGSWENAVSFE